MDLLLPVQGLGQNQCEDKRERGEGTIEMLGVIGHGKWDSELG